jgi:hypothetical protein
VEANLHTVCAAQHGKTYIGEDFCLPAIGDGAGAVALGEVVGPGGPACPPTLEYSCHS